MNITVNEELRIYIDPLTPEEHDALERSILAEGCRDALVLWGDMLVDGHNRYGICRKHGISFQTVQNPRFQSIEDVHLWMIDQHLGRRSVSDFQRGVLALRKKDILAARVQAAQATQAAAHEAIDQAIAPGPVLPPDPLNSREAIARAARISSTTVSQIEKIQKTAAPELVAAVKAGEVSINAAAAVASLPVEEQVAAVAGGKKQLQQAARQVREAKASTRAPRPADADASAQSSGTTDAPEAAGPGEEGKSSPMLVAHLREIIAELRAENDRLKARLAELGDTGA